MSRPEERIDWIDTLRGIGILLVVLGHAFIETDALKTYILSFHVPLFFFISGYLFDQNKFDGYASFVKRKITTIVIPYFSFFLLSHAHTLVRTYLGDPQGFKTAYFYEPLIAALYGTGEWLLVVNNIALWFLPCLFVTQNLYFGLSKMANSSLKMLSLLIAAIPAVAYAVNVSGAVTRAPWSADVALTALLFYGTGHVVKEAANRENIRFLSNRAVALPLVFLSILTGAAASAANDTVIMVHNHYGNYFYFLLSAYAGIIAATLLARNVRTAPCLKYLGKNSLVLLVLHYWFLQFSYFLANKLVGSFTAAPLEDLLPNSVWALISAAFATLCVVPLITVVNTFFPFMTGRIKST